jgi:hypothetical protein
MATAKKPRAKGHKQLVVEALCHDFETPTKDKQKRLNKNAEWEETITTICPKCKGCTIYKAGTGFGNPHDHLARCFTSAKLATTYAEACEKRRSTAYGRQDIRASLGIEAMANDRELALATWVNLIVDKNVIPSLCEDRDYHQELKHDAPVSCKAVKGVIHALVELVEGVIAKQMENKIGSILHDGWTKRGVHYVAIYAVYMLQGLQEINLLAVSPLPAIEMDDVDNNNAGEVQEATDFNAETIVNYFDSTFNYYGFEKCNKFAVVQTADSASVNIKAARLMDIEHKPCDNHLLNLEVGDLYKVDNLMSSLIEKISELALKVRRSCKNRGLLRRCGTELTPKAKNKTRWNSGHAAMEWHLKITESLQKMIVENPDRNISDETVTAGFCQDCKKSEKQLDIMKNASVLLQKKGYIIHEG